MLIDAYAADTDSDDADADNATDADAVTPGSTNKGVTQYTSDHIIVPQTVIFKRMAFPMLTICFSPTSKNFLPFLLGPGKPS